MPYTPTTWYKGGETRVAYSPTEAIELEFDGWTLDPDTSAPPYVINPVLAEAIQDALSTFLVEGTNINLEYDDEEDALVISATGSGSFDAEGARDAIMASITGVGLVNVAVSDALDTIVITTTATANDTDANLRARALHTGEQPQSSITGLVTALGNLQPLNANLTTLAGLTPTTNNFIVAVGSAWASRTVAQVKSTLSLNLVDNVAAASLRDRTTHTGTQSADTIVDGTTNKVLTAADKTKLTGIATGATANDTDANLKARANHTGTQSSSTISDLTEAVQDIVGAFLAQGTGVTLGYDDAGNSLTITAAGGGGGLDAEGVRDAIGVALLGSGLISVVANDAGDTITVSTTATANDTDANLKNRANHTGTQSADTVVDGTTNKAFTAAEKTKLGGVTTGATANDTDANLKNRANHTGSQASSTISDFTEAVQDAVGTLLQDAGNIDVTYNDAGNVETIDIISSPTFTGTTTMANSYRSGSRREVLAAAVTADPALTVSSPELVLCNAAGGAFNVTPPATTVPGIVFCVKKVSSGMNVVTILGTFKNPSGDLTNLKLYGPNQYHRFMTTSVSGTFQPLDSNDAEVLVGTTFSGGLPDGVKWGEYPA